MTQKSKTNLCIQIVYNLRIVKELDLLPVIGKIARGKGTTFD
jgi:hypothetical protein